MVTIERGPYQEVIEIMRGLVHDEYKLNDIAHQIDHADTVAVRAIEYTETAIDMHYPELKPMILHSMTIMAIIAAYAHDVRCYIDRDIHHILGGQWCLDNKAALMRLFSLNEDNIKCIAVACSEHRASFKDVHTYLLSEIISCADRGRPSMDVKEYYGRSYIYSRDKLGSSIEQAIEHSVKHTTEKFGLNGYVNYPNLYRAMFRDDLETYATRIEECSKVIADDKEHWEQCEARYQRMLAKRNSLK